MEKIIRLTLTKKSRSSNINFKQKFLAQFEISKPLHQKWTNPAGVVQLQNDRSHGMLITFKPQTLRQKSIKKDCWKAPSNMEVKQHTSLTDG
jgi:hypothetical protein